MRKALQSPSSFVGRRFQNAVNATGVSPKAVVAAFSTGKNHTHLRTTGSFSTLGSEPRSAASSGGFFVPAASSWRFSVNEEIGIGALLAASALLVAVHADTFFAAPGTALMESKVVDSDETRYNDNGSHAESEGEEDDTTTVINWSGTHTVHVKNKNYFEPETVEELENIVRKCYQTNTAVRPLGSALSPNGIGFNADGMVSLANLDKVIKVDKEKMTVTVQAGARVSQVVDALREQKLTLPNLASIAEQQMGGFVQVGAHGTGARITPVDDFVVSLKLVTPAKGTIELNADDGELFHLAKVGLGCLGVVAEITMKCIPAHNLVEHTYVLSRAQAKAQIKSLLKKHKHVRYMWIPYEDAVVVVTNDPEIDALDELVVGSPQSSDASTRERFRPLTELLAKLTAGSEEPYTEETMQGMGFGELRDALLAVNPLDANHVKMCNKAEAEFWRLSEGYQTKPSDQLLQFDCGGQQWVWEICFPTGTYTENNGNDMAFMEELLTAIEEKKITAHSPIEQRWTASSSSLMSPAHGPPEGLHSWVGIIMYLPSDEESQRQQITAKFKGEYCDLLRMVGHKVNAVSHWAKLEIPSLVSNHTELNLFMQRRYPTALFNAARFIYDPTNLLSNDLINNVLGRPRPASRSGHHYKHH